MHTSEPIKITQATARVFKIEYLDINICKSKKNSFKILLVAQAEFDSLFLNSLEHLSWLIQIKPDNGRTNVSENHMKNMELMYLLVSF